MSNFMKIHLAGAGLSHADGQTDHEANSHVAQFCEWA